jgi:serine/threonine protein kinase
MFNLLPTKGLSYSRTTKQQIKSLNKILKTMNECALNQPEELTPLYQKLVAFHRKKVGGGSAKQPIKDWFVAHPLFQIDRVIQQAIKEKTILTSITELSQQADLIAIYRRYEGKDSFRTLIEQQLHDIDEGIEVVNLGGGNNPVVRVRLDEDRFFIMRFLRVGSQEDYAGVSPRCLRDSLQNVDELPMPYLLTPVEDDRQEVTYLEFSPYYERGSLADHFKKLREQKDKKSIDTNQLVLIYAQKMISFLSKINPHNIWYTDLKPENILLPMMVNEDYVVINDIKGLILSPNNKIRRNMVSMTPAYYQSSVYEGRDVHLDLLQRQTLANTLYELACGKLPIPEITHQPDWKNQYNFDQPCFKNPEGLFLVQFIRELNRSQAFPLTHFTSMIEDFEDTQIRTFLQRAEGEKPFIGLDDSSSLSSW